MGGPVPQARHHRNLCQDDAGRSDDMLDANGEDILDWKDAQKQAQVWFERQARGERRSGPLTVSDALDDYIKKFRGKSVAKTKGRIEVIIRPALGHHKVHQLTRKIIADWHNARAESPAKLRTSKRASQPNLRPLDSDEAIRRRRSTANRDLTVLKAALNRAADDRSDLPVEAWRGVKPFGKVDGAKLRYLTDDEARKLVAAVEPAFKAMVQGALLTGARYGELTGVRVRDFDPEAAVLWLRETKSNVVRAVYLDEEGAALFQSRTNNRASDALIFPRPDGKRWGASQHARPLALACQAAKIEPAGFHDLRRTYGARMALKGVPMAVIAQALGHADERITRKHYAHLSPSYLAETIRAGVAGLGIIQPVLKAA